jgi:hypothetical protein
MTNKTRHLAFADDFIRAEHSRKLTFPYAELTLIKQTR